MNLSQTNKTLRFLAVYLPINALAVAMLIVFTGLWPRTTIAWVIFLTFGFPVWLLGEYIGDKLFGDKISKKIDSSGKKVSLLRIGYALVIMIIFLAVMTGTYHNFKGFWAEHFVTWHLTTG